MKSPYSVDAEAILAELRGCAVTHIVTMPDYVQLSVHQLLESGRWPEASLIKVCSEDEAIVVAAGLHIAGKVPIVMMQNQGLYACLNNLRAIGIDASMPIFMMIGQWGREPGNLGKSSRESIRFAVRKVEPLLETLEIPYFRLEGPEDLPNIAKAFEACHERQCPTALLVGAPTGWSTAALAPHRAAPIPTRVT